MCKLHGYRKPKHLYNHFCTNNPATKQEVRQKLSYLAKQREIKRRNELITNGTYFKLQERYAHAGEFSKQYAITTYLPQLDEIIDYYRLHTKEDTLNHFQLNTERQLKKLCRIAGYKKSQVDIQNTINLKYGCSGGYFTSTAFDTKMIRRTFAKHSSKAEMAWLNACGIPEDCRQVYVGNRFTVDGLYDNIVYEYLGDYWHGNPKFYLKYKDKPYYEQYLQRAATCRQKTLEKFKYLSEQGYKIRYIWEGDKSNLIKYREFNGLLE